MLELLTIVSLIIIVGYLLNLISLSISILLYFIVTDKILRTPLGSSYEKEYRRVSDYEFYTFIDISIPYLFSFKVIEYIITYRKINKDTNKEISGNVFSKFLLVEDTLKSKRR